MHSFIQINCIQLLAGATGVVELVVVYSAGFVVFAESFVLAG